MEYVKVEHHHMPCTYIYVRERELTLAEALCPGTGMEVVLLDLPGVVTQLPLTAYQGQEGGKRGEYLPLPSRPVAAKILLHLQEYESTRFRFWTQRT